MSVSAMRANPLADLLEALVGHLAERGHRPTVIQQYLQAAEHFGRWWGRRRAGRAIDRCGVRLFLDEHLPTCRCRPPAPRQRHSVRAALEHLIEVRLLRDGDMSVQAAVEGPHDELLSQFDRHMRDNCGLAPVTRGYRLRYAREFLLEKFGRSAPQWAILSAEDVIGFVSSVVGRLRTGQGWALQNRPVELRML